MANRRKELKIEGANLWYLVGLITSDGCLSKDKRHIDITSKDRKFLLALKEQVSFTNKIGIKNKDTRKQAYRIQIANKGFYDFLFSVGLMQNKSLKIGAINIPETRFPDFLRGLIDGDGCVRRWAHNSNFCEQWSLRIYSGSKGFLEWLEQRIGIFIKANAKLYKHNKQGTAYVLKFGKMAAREIIKKCYYEGCFGLQRKITLVNKCINSDSGWSRSKTVGLK